MKLFNSYVNKLQQILLHKMDSSSGQQQKQMRRKRKDPESRDFSCKCGKSYLSYAAAYTHVKNKHDGDSQFLNGISKPDRQKLKRGRPKEKKPFSITTETEKLSIIEQAILQIYDALEKLERQKQNTGKIILEGNHQVRLDELMRIYEELKTQIGQPGLTLFIDNNKYGEGGRVLGEFIQCLNKHFVPQIAAKVIWFVNYVLANQVHEGENQFQIDIQVTKARMTDQVCIKLWDNIKEIPEHIINALEKWIKVVEKKTQSTLKLQ